MLLGMTGLLGSRTSAVTGSAGGYQLSVIYPRVTRPGLPVRWIYTIGHPGGFNGKIDVLEPSGKFSFVRKDEARPNPSHESRST